MNHSEQNYRVYKVGGAVRDTLLGLPVTETDWVVVGAVPDDLLSQGYRQVGKDFPVFLHPDTGEEYALARTERKSGHGYHGFTVHADPDVTLEQDLERRDLTVNAMAMDADGQVIDPWGGQRDLKRRQLRHVSTAFTEDPLRVLRVARFAARFHTLGFTVAPETQQLMSDIAASGELAHLAEERVWTETLRALGGPTPHIYFEVLADCGALAVLMPGIDHPAIQRLAASAPLIDPAIERWSVMLAGLPGETVQAINNRLKCPNDFRLLAELAHSWCQKMDAANPDDWLTLFTRLQPDKRPGIFQAFLAVMAALAGQRPADRNLVGLTQKAWQEMQSVQAATFIEEGLRGPAIGNAMKAERRQRLERLISDHPSLRAAAGQPSISE